jgi:hypothetical protein
VSVTGTSVHGSVLERWSGATTSMGGNGNDDGRFLVAVKVTGPNNGMWHYEYAVHNVDNDRGGAAIRLPVCAAARVENVGFHDIDRNPINDWAVSRQGGELAVLASANNPLDWNTIYNVWFDTDAAPVAGTMNIDEARPGPGALSVGVATTVPGLVGSGYLGAGCGSPEPSIAANGVPASPNAAFAVDLQAAPSAFAVLAFAQQPASIALGNGCDLLIDNTQLIGSFLLQADGSGAASFGIAIPPGLPPTDLFAQAFEFVSGGPALGLMRVSNGLAVHAAAAGCP